MNYEQIIARHIVEARYEDLGEKDVEVVKRQLMAFFGAAIAGWNAEGCPTICEMAREQGGTPEATILIHGVKVPAQNAAFVNSAMGRALDYCDHIAPGLQITATVVPAALAAAELAGNYDPKDLITAVAVGTDLSLRLNLTDADFDGFDPTGVDAMFSTSAAAAKIMKLNEEQTLHALALAFNRCGGSFQSNIDGSLAVRIIEGWVAKNGIECAKLAARGITGPKNFLSGVYGYRHIFGRDHLDLDKVVKDLGKVWHMHTLGFKKYPCCGQTLGSSEMILHLMEENGFAAKDIDKIRLYLNDFTYKLVGKQFEPGENPKVDAQFNAGYCVANAAVRRQMLLKHFEPEYIFDDEVLSFLHDHIEVIETPALHERGHYSADMEVRLLDGRVFTDSNDIPPGCAGNELKEIDNQNRYYDCVDFSGLDWIRDRADTIYEALTHIEGLEDLRSFIKLFEGAAESE